MAFRDFDELFKTDEPIQFKHKSVVYDLPSELSFALEMQINEYISEMGRKPEDELTTDDLKGLYRLLMNDTFDALWDSGISKDRLEAILTYWQEERQRLSPKALTPSNPQTQTVVKRGKAQR